MNSWTIFERCAPHGLGTVDVSPLMLEDRNEYYVNRVFIPIHARGQGMGARLMSRLAEKADRDGTVLYIDPTANYGSDVKRLTRFFERFGFKVVNDEQKGSMCRRPGTPIFEQATGK